MNGWFWCVVAALALGLLGCGMPPPTPPPAAVCMPDSTRACSCNDGRSGTQRCNFSGSGYLACECPTAMGVCTPSARVGCTCDDGSLGLQTCRSDGSGFSACGDCMPTCTPQCGSRRCGDDGCGGSCGSCIAGQMCSSGRCVDAPCSPACSPGFTCDRGRCELDPTSRWTVVAVSGIVSQRTCAGETWDPLGGLPDPIFCMTLNGVKTCTSYGSDTTSVRWNARFPVATASELLGGVVVSWEDSDNTSNDIICSGTVRFTTANLATGRMTQQCAPCPNGVIPASVELTFAPAL